MNAKSKHMQLPPAVLTWQEYTDANSGAIELSIRAAIESVIMWHLNDGIPEYHSQIVGTIENGIKWIHTIISDFTTGAIGCENFTDDMIRITWHSEHGNIVNQCEPDDSSEAIEYVNAVLGTWRFLQSNLAAIQYYVANQSKSKKK